MSTTETALKISLLSREMVAEGTMSFRFAKPPNFSYRAGQSVDMTLLDPPETDAEGNVRPFTLSSAPREDVITITTRLRDTAFKRVLQVVPLGTEVKIEGPFGDFRLHNAARPAMLLAGGIGITPFRSILVETIGGGGSLPYRVVMFHANRRPEEAAFTDQMRTLERADSNLTYVPTVTAQDVLGQAWNGERGRIDQEMLRRHLEGVINPICYIAGPIEMVKALRAILTASGVDEDDIRTDEFTGY
jgi:ferredoxin-NADP reductase